MLDHKAVFPVSEESLLGCDFTPAVRREIACLVNSFGKLADSPHMLGDEEIPLRRMKETEIIIYTYFLAAIDHSAELDKAYQDMCDEVPADKLQNMREEIAALAEKMDQAYKLLFKSLSSGLDIGGDYQPDIRHGHLVVLTRQQLPIWGKIEEAEEEEVAAAETAGIGFGQAFVYFQGKTVCLSIPEKVPTLEGKKAKRRLDS
ncbi:MAG: hypothetical protein Q8O59_04390 [bacterium]|nr:hypothetical protein [bacterium]